MHKLNRTIALIAGTVMAVGGAATLEARELIFGHPQSSTSAFHAGAVAFAEKLAEETNGNLTAQIFPSGSLGGEREMVEGLQIGSIDVVLTSTGPVGNFVPETLITDIPFLFRDYDHARKVLDGDIGQAILEKFTSKGIVGLAWAENGFRHLTNSARSVNSPADIDGLKIRTMENPVHMKAFEALGALPSPMAFPEVFPALQQKIVDGQENPIPVIISSNFGEVQKHLTLTGHVYSPALFLTSVSAFSDLSAEEKDAMITAAQHGTAVMRQKVEDIEKSGIAKLQNMGVNVVTDVDKSLFQDALKDVYVEFAEEFGQENIAQIKAVK